MSLKSIFALAVAAILAIFAVSITIAWRAEQRARTQLQEQLKSAQEQITDATRRQSGRAALEQQVAQLQKKQAATKTSDEIIQAFPGVLPLPKPLTILDSPKTGTQTEGDWGRLTQAPGRVSQAKADTPAPQVILPAEDLKPLYDSAVQCKECQLQLTIAQANLRDAQAKTAAVSRELADAVRVANGGSPLRGVARAAK
jgi:type II secretory pathway pseudopilin PulG